MRNEQFRFPVSDDHIRNKDARANVSDTRHVQR
jgi:hypothetical protein